MGLFPDTFFCQASRDQIDLGDSHYWRGDCGEGCLFNVQEDHPEKWKEQTKDSPRIAEVGLVSARGRGGGTDSRLFVW